VSWASVVTARLRALLGYTRLERELDDEVRFHLEMQLEDNLNAGMNQAEARFAALRSFGGIESMKQQYRERRAFALVEETAQDLRYAVRTLIKSPGYTATAVVVLAWAIGVNTAMFSVLNAVLFRPLPYPSPEQLVVVWRHDPSKNLREGRTAYWTADQWRKQSKSFVDMAFFDGASATLTTADQAHKISVIRTSPNLFPLLGIRPLHGRVFTVEEAEQRQRLALISYRFWQARFGRSLEAIGASIFLDGAPSRIIGILPAEYESDDDVWEPYSAYPDWENVRSARGGGAWTVIGRLRPNVTIEQAQAELNAIARGLDEPLPEAQRPGVSVVPMSLQVVGPRSRMTLWMLAGAVLLVLLIAVTNIASLSLARSASREREIAIRAALGANRARIIRQLLTESLTLAVAAGLLGLLVAYGGIRLILAVKPVNLARLNEVSVDPYVLGCALALCLLSGILVGLTPAITASRRNLRSSGQQGGRGIAGGSAMVRTRRALVVTEFAMAIMLLAGAGLLVRSLLSVQNVELGFRSERLLVVALAPPASMAPEMRTGFYRRVLEEVESMPGVERAAITSELFLSGNPTQVITTEGDSRLVGERKQMRSDELSEGFFTAIGTPLLKGRFFSAEDGRPGSPRVVIINDAMARQVWPGQDPVGTRFKFGPENARGPWYTVVGVVGDMRRQGLERETIPQMFEPLAQNPSRRGLLLVRTATADPLSIAREVQAVVRRVEKYAPVYGVSTAESQLEAFLTDRRFQTSLLIGFSVAAVLMAAIGIYGLIQYSIAMRTHEIGIRMAVGAESRQIFRMVLGEGLKLSLTGLAIGLVGALGLGQAISSLLFGVSPTDSLTFVSVSLLLITVGLAACCFPARRAMKVEPVAALRQD
jgi:predicted permease